ncbi:50S ribosomal protein L29 [Candidatus Saccharibacteria bacterium]|jgi:ribosomal protein L29|nr:50S ribosomal protein L29 [Candidatus Saccharibacteria bacterium]MCA9313149.1 50S ribosomal protein L29 [Candidatus Saccharibacteria bacterium]
MNMKLLLVKDLRSKKVADISEYINNLKTELHSLSHDASVGKSKKSHEFRVLKKSIAQAKTILTEVSEEKEK